MKEAFQRGIKQHTLKIRACLLFSHHIYNMQTLPENIKDFSIFYHSVKQGMYESDWEANAEL